MGLFSFYWCGDNTFICLQDPFFLRAPSPPAFLNHYRRRHRLHISQRCVSSHRRERAALNAPVQAVINTQGCFSLSSASCLRLRWRGSTSFQLWLLPVMGLLVSVMSTRCVAPCALQDDFPNHYAVLWRPPARSLTAAGPPVNALRVCLCARVCFHLSRLPNSDSELNAKCKCLAFFKFLILFFSKPVVWWSTEIGIVLFAYNVFVAAGRTTDTVFLGGVLCGNESSSESVSYWFRKRITCVCSTVNLIWIVCCSHFILDVIWFHYWYWKAFLPQERASLFFMKLLNWVDRN